jgi:hypothetical protein
MRSATATGAGAIIAAIAATMTIGASIPGAFILLGVIVWVQRAISGYEEK